MHCSVGASRCPGATLRFTATSLPDLIALASTDRLCANHADGCCRAIAHFVGPDPATVLHLGGAQSLLAVLRLHERSLVAVRPAMGTLERLAQSVLVPTGSWSHDVISATIERVLAVQRHFETDEYIASTGSNLIATLTRQPGTYETIGTVPVAEALVAMIRRFSSGVTERAALAIRNLALSIEVAPRLLAAG